MSADAEFEQSMVGKFIKDINYPALQSQRQEPRQIDMDWRAELASVKDQQGTLWQGQFQEPYIESFGQGYLRGVLRSGDKKMSIVVTSLSAKNWPERLDYVVQQLTNTNRPTVNAKLIPSQADLYFGPAETPGTTFCSFLLADFYVAITSLDFEDVTPLAQALIKIMLQHAQKPAAQLTGFTAKPPQTPALLNARVDVQVTGLPANTQLQAPSSLLPEEVTLTAQDNNTLSFKIGSPGKKTIPIVAMDAKTLRVSQQTVEIIVN